MEEHYQKGIESSVIKAELCNAEDREAFGCEGQSSLTSDDVILARLGKKAVLKRNFGFWQALGFSCTLLITWEAALIGGRAGVVYGYIFIWLGTLSVFITLSELASMAPISSGQYHWVAMLAPQRSRRFLSYITGWFTVTGWLANASTGAYLSGTLIQGLIILTRPSYEPKAWQGTLLCWAVILFTVLVNTVVGSALPKFEGFLLILHVVGFVALVVPLVALSGYDTASDVFTTFHNGGNWPTQGLSFFVGLLGFVFSFFGADGAIHMSEEIRNAAVVVPRSMLFAIVLNGILGFGMMIAFLFCLGDLDAALDSKTGYPFMEVFLRGVKSVAGAAIMASLIVVMAICATVALAASASRVVWSFARDRALPGWTLFSKVDKRTSIPVPAVGLTVLVACLLSLINIGSSTVFNDITGLTVSALYSSYIIVTVLFLWRRYRGDIKVEGEDVTPQGLVWGPWRVPGLIGIINNIITIAFLIIIWFFAFWPPVTPVVASTMNYNALFLGAIMIFSTIYYFAKARKIYTGPIVEVSMD